MAALLSGAAIVQTPGVQPTGRLTVILGDLHLGIGVDPQTGEWHPFEDFRWGDAFAAFLSAVDRSGNGATDLVLNGDTFELWQPIDDECRFRPEEPALGCTEAEALARLERILAAHQSELSVLAAFARSGANRITLVPGDRDAALLFPSLAARVVSALSAPDRVDVAAAGYWLSADGGIYAEHGHQRAYDPFRLVEWPAPFVKGGGAVHLERSWGEQLVQSFYDRYEPRYPLVDNIAEDGVGVTWVATADPDALATIGLEPAIRLLLSRMTWSQFRLDLDAPPVEAPEWDVGRIRDAGSAFFVDSLLPDAPAHALAAAAQKEGRLSLNLADLSDEQLMAICDYRAALRRARRRLERKLSQLSHVGPAMPECPRTPDTRGSAFEFFWRSRDAIYGERLGDARRASERRGGAARPIRVFVYGHTHLQDPGFVPGQSGEGPLVLSPGAWQRTISPTHLRQITSDSGWTDVDVLRELQPEDLPSCYGVVWIEPYEAQPSPQVRFWREDGRWGRAPRDAVGVTDPCPAGGGG